jgi:hypothetical protein
MVNGKDTMTYRIVSAIIIGLRIATVATLTVGMYLAGQAGI